IGQAPDFGPKDIADGGRLFLDGDFDGTADERPELWKMQGIRVQLSMNAHHDQDLLVALFYLNVNTIAARNTQAFPYFCAPPLYNGFGFLATDKGPPTTDILDALATNRIHPEGRLPRPVGLGGAAGADLATRGADSAVHLGRTGPVPGNRGGAEIA